MVANHLCSSDARNQRLEDKTGYWGNRAAGCLFHCVTTNRVLFSRRARTVSNPSTWACWGGAVDPNESVIEGLKREVREETGYTGKYVLQPLTVFRAPDADFEYFSFVARVDEEFIPRLCDENDGFRWTAWGTWPTPLHPEMGAVIRALYKLD